MSKGVFVFTPQHSGSSFFIHTLRMCGMYYGKDTYGWNDTYYHHIERSDIIKKVDNIKYNKEGYDKTVDYDYIKQVLESYKHKSEVFGIKLTAFSYWSWIILRPIFEEIWGNDLIYCTIIRNPFKKYESDRELTNFYMTMIFQLQLLKSGKFRCLLFPDYWDDGRIIPFINGLGLTWNNDVYQEQQNLNPTHSVYTNGYVSDKVTRLGYKDAIYKKFPEMMEVFHDLLDFILPWDTIKTFTGAE